MDGRTGEVRMLSITENARSKLDEFAEQAEETELAVKVAITGRGPKGFQYDLQLVPPSEAAEGDVVTEVDGLTVIIAEKSAAYLDGATLDFVETLMGPGGFQFENPNPLWLDPLAQRVADVLDEEVNPAVASHGGNVTLIDVVEGVRRRLSRLLGGRCDAEARCRDDAHGEDSGDRRCGRHHRPRRRHQPVLLTAGIFS